MRKISFFMAILFCLVSFGQVNAALSVTSDNLAVQDSVSGLYWWRDLSTFNGFNGQVNGVDMTYANQKALIGTLTGGSFHMATWNEMQGLANNSAQSMNLTFKPIGNSFVDPVWVNVFVGRYDLSLSGGMHSVGTMDWDTTNNVKYYPTNSSNIGLNSSASDTGYGGIGAWAVTASYTPQSPASVPEPATMLFLGFGLVGLAGVRRFRK